jgi:phytoene synthase
MTVAASRQILARGSKSFALAARLLPRGVADDAAVVYAWCRRADDRVDEGEASEATVRELREELDSIYAGAPQPDPQLAAFQDVALRRSIPRAYLDELLDGMEMDVHGASYATLQDLLVYCHRVAGTVGLMMCHVMGVRDRRALRHAALLGIAMQLTNICRDVADDWRKGRVYLPAALFGRSPPGGPFPRELRDAGAEAIRALLREADRYYASAEAGIGWLGFRCALAVRTARSVYAEIGRRVEARRCDPLAGRAVVPLWRKLLLAARALVTGLRDLRPGLPAPSSPQLRVRFPDDVLPL